MTDTVLLAVGNSMMGDDGAGPLLVEMLERDPVPDWVVIDGGSAPENYAHQVLALAPRRVVIVDAADMGLNAGEIRIVDEKCIAEMFFMTTHNLPISFLIERLREQVSEVVFLGIQPAVVAYGFPLMDVVRQAVENVFERIRSGQGLDTIECLVAV
jgi:hydrogenase 3 maturation protease